VPANGLELSCPAARALPHPLYGNLAGKASSNFPNASRVRCSELLGSAQELWGLVDRSPELGSKCAEEDRRSEREWAAER
jgi:hypothetical protein